MNPLPEIDAIALIQARSRRNKKHFRELLDFYRKRYSDAEIVRAMADSRAMINPLKLNTRS